MSKMSQRSDLSTKQFLQSFLSGGIAGVISKTLGAPIERIKCIYIVTIFLL